MKNKLIVMMLAFCLMMTSTGLVFALDEIEVGDGPAEARKIEQALELEREKKEEAKETASESISEPKEDVAASESKVEEDKEELKEKDTETLNIEDAEDVKEKQDDTNTGVSPTSEDDESEVTEPVAEPEPVKDPVTKVTVKLYARNGSGNYYVAQTWTAVESGSNTWANANTNANKYSPVTKGETTYTYTGVWVDDFGNSYTIGGKKYGKDFIALFDGQEGPTATLNVYAQYDEYTIPTITINYIDNIGHAGSSDSWKDDGKIAYTHTFNSGVDVPSQYTFLYWKNFDNGDIKNPGETFTINKGEITKDTTITYYAVYDYQPAVRVKYHYKNGLKDTGAKLSDINIYENQPENLYWFYADSTEPIVEGTVASLPAKIEKIIDPQNYTEQVDVYAHYYTVTFINDSGEILEVDENVPYGTIPSYDGAVPTKEATKQYTYKFTGWDKDITQPVTDNIIYVATYLSIVNKYKVTFVDEDKSVLKDATEYDYGTSASDIETPDEPTKAATEQYKYTFTGWTPEIVDVTDDVVYTATYAATAIEKPVIEPDPVVDPVVEPIIGPDAPIAPKPPKTPTTEEATPTTPTQTITGMRVATTSPSDVVIADTTEDEIQSEDVIITDITDSPVVKTAPEGTWALLNLICVILGFIFIAISLLMRKDTDDEATEDEENEDDKTRRQINANKVVNIIIGVLALVAFILTEDMSLKMAFTDEYTLLMIIMTLINGADTAIIAKKTNQDNSEENIEE